MNRNDLEKFTLVFRLFWNSRIIIVKITGIVGVIAIVISLLLPKTFKSSSILLPQTNNSVLSSLGGLSNLASIAGVSFGQVQIEQLFPDILKSEAVLKTVLYKKYYSIKYVSEINLIDYWEISEDSALSSYEVALEKIRKDLDISFDRKTNIVIISLTMKEPQLAADVVNEIVKSLDSYLQNNRVTNATEQRLWIEKRLKQIQDDLRKSENELRDFQDRNKMVSNSPLLQLEQQRLLRNVEINTTIFIELKKQFEIAKIEELKNIPIINILDTARPAGKKDGPKRAIIVIVATFLGFISSCGYVYYKSYYKDKLKSYLKTIFSN